MKIKIYIILLLFLSSCATYQTQYGKSHTNWQSKIMPKENPIYTVYLVGDAGKLDKKGINIVTKAVGKKLEKETTNSALIYLGDNIYPNGFPKKNDKNRANAEKILDAQINAVKNYKGKTVFIPGNHDLRQGFNGIKRQEKYIEKALENTKIFFP